MNIDIMAMFPDDFPFNRREAEVAETDASTGPAVVEAQPLAADAFSDDFPFNRREAEAPAAAPVAADGRPVFMPTSSIFPAGFPFVEPQPVVVQPAPQAEVVTAIVESAALPVVDLTADELAAFAPSPAAPIPAPAPVAPLPFKDRRRSPRQRMHARATLRLDNVGGNPLHVEIHNLSLLGVRIHTNRELLINDKANLRLEVGPLKWATRLRVINCLRNSESSYTIGCEFVGNELARGRVAA